MIDLKLHCKGVILPVKAQAAARRSVVSGEHHGMLKVSVTQAAEKGKANKAIIHVIAKELGLKKSQIELISGQTNSLKKFLVTGITLELLSQRILQILTGRVSEESSDPEG